MAFPRLITDNTIELLRDDGRIGTARPAKDNAEFFWHLEEKTKEDFDRMLEATDIDKKINSLADLYEDINAYASALGKKEIFIDGKMKDRREKMGEFSLRLILESVVKEEIRPTFSEEDIQFIKKTGEEDGYPIVNIARNSEGKVFMKSLLGKESWEKQIGSTRFAEFLDAVRRKDYDMEIQK